MSESAQLALDFDSACRWVCANAPSLSYSIERRLIDGVLNGKISARFIWVESFYVDDYKIIARTEQEAIEVAKQYGLQDYVPSERPGGLEIMKRLRMGYYFSNQGVDELMKLQGKIVAEGFNNKAEKKVDNAKAAEKGIEFDEPEWLGSGYQRVERHFSFYANPPKLLMVELGLDMVKSLGSKYKPHFGGCLIGVETSPGRGGGSNGAL